MRPAASWRPRADAWRRSRAALMPVAVFLVIGAAWSFVTNAFEVSPLLLPGPIAVLRTMVEERQVLVEAAVSTMSEILLASAIAIVAGFGTAVIIGTSQLVRRAVFPYILATQVVPKVALAPILIAWFGIGMESRLALAFLISYFPMVINTLAGLLGTGEGVLRYAHSLAASEWQILIKVRLPAATPSIVSGVKITAGVAVIGIVVGEFVATDRGLGKVIIDSSASLDTSLTIAATLIIGVLGLLMLGALEVVEKWIVYWQPGR